MRISDWSSDVCSSDLGFVDIADRRHPRVALGEPRPVDQPGRAVIALAGVDFVELDQRRIPFLLRRRPTPHPATQRQYPMGGRVGERAGPVYTKSPQVRPAAKRIRTTIMIEIAWKKIRNCINRIDFRLDALGWVPFRSAADVLRKIGRANV